MLFVGADDPVAKDIMKPPAPKRANAPGLARRIRCLHKHGGLGKKKKIGIISGDIGRALRTRRNYSRRRIFLFSSDATDEC